MKLFLTLTFSIGATLASTTYCSTSSTTTTTSTTAAEQTALATPSPNYLEHAQELLRQAGQLKQKKFFEVSDNPATAAALEEVVTKLDALSMQVRLPFYAHVFLADWFSDQLKPKSDEITPETNTYNVNFGKAIMYTTDLGLSSPLGLAFFAKILFKTHPEIEPNLTGCMEAMQQCTDPTILDFCITALKKSKIVERLGLEEWAKQVEERVYDLEQQIYTAEQIKAFNRLISKAITRTKNSGTKLQMALKHAQNIADENDGLTEKECDYFKQQINYAQDCNPGLLRRRIAAIKFIEGNRKNKKMETS